MNLDRKAYESIDWSMVWKHLYVYAVKLIGGADLLIDCGFSAEDLASQTLLEFWESTDGLKWKKSKGPLERFLGKVLRNNFIDHIRRDHKILGSFDDDDFQKGLPSSNLTVEIEKELQSNSSMNAVYQRVSGNKQLEDLVTAASMTTKEGKKNQQMAELLGTTTADIVNRKKHLLKDRKIRELL